MPTYDFMCTECGTVREKVVPSAVRQVDCLKCPAPTATCVRLLSAPASIRMGDGSQARKAQRIKEPIWRYPDGHIESLNSKNTRPEE